MLSVPALDVQTVAQIQSPVDGGPLYSQEVAMRHLGVVRSRESANTYVIVYSTASFATWAPANAEAAASLAMFTPLQDEWRRLVCNPMAPSDVDTLTTTVDACLEMVSRFGPKGLNLENLTAAEVHCEHLAAVLRATMTWRNETPGWADALMVAAEACAASGHDPHDVLFGMI